VNIRRSRPYPCSILEEKLKKMKVTVCQMSDAPEDFARDWEKLAAHLKAESSQLALLPEMPFCAWFAVTRKFDPTIWEQAVEAHKRWMARVNELAPAIVLGSRPVNQEGRRLNQGFVWNQADGYRAAHLKYYLPDEDGFWEASWYDRGDQVFVPVECGEALAGFQICTDLWFMDRARAYGQAGAHLIATPRATPLSTADKWLAGGRAAAVIAGAFSLSSNRSPALNQPVTFGGHGWIINPEGEVLGLTSPERPFLTLEIDLKEAERAKTTYPRYVRA
jgi:N-carbamoylputrescine amidase